MATTPLGTSTHVSVPLPRPLVGDDVQITIGDYDARTTLDWYTADAVDLPVAIAEVGLPVPRSAAATTTIDTGCRSDLVTVDGRRCRCVSTVMQGRLVARRAHPHALRGDLGARRRTS